MKEGKAIAYIGIIIAIDTALWKLIPQKAWFILISCALLLLCILINKVEFWFYNSHHKWIDWIFYVISKNDRPYKISLKKLEYSIQSEAKAEYTTESDIEITRPIKDFCFIGMYQWEQEEEIDFRLIDSDLYQYKRTDEYNWTSVNIKPKKPIKKKESLRIGFELKKLNMNNLARHSFLSHKCTAKVKNLQMIAKVNKNLHPTKAEFIVKDVFEHEIKKEYLDFDERTESFTKSIYCPRKGRTYVIQWGYDKIENAS